MSDRAEPRRAPMTEQDLRAAWVVEPPRLTGRIQVVDYDPEWPRLYQREADRIGAALGERVVRLEHIGSTSVPGLAAKPIVDIMLVVPDSSSGNPSGTSTAASRARTPTSISMSTRPGARRSSGTSSSATGCAATRTSGRTTSGSSVS